MVEETYTLSAQRTGATSKQLTVPAEVQREEDIAIDDEVEVAIHGVSDLIDRASFTGTQTAGDRVTISADVVRQLGLVAGEEYEFSFEKVTESDEDLPGAISDEEVEEELDEFDSIIDEALEEAESEPDDDGDSLGELFSDDEFEEDEQEEEGLGELFG